MTLAALLAAVARRIRRKRAAEVAVLAAGAWGVLAVLLVLADRVVEVPASAAIALAGFGVALVGAGLAAWLRPVPALLSARYADRDLGARDRFATALELRSSGIATPLGVRQIASAEAYAAGTNPRGVARPRISLALAAVPVVAAVLTLVVAVLPNTRAEAAAVAAADAARVEAAAAFLEEEAARLDDLDAGTAEALRDLAEELRGAEDLEEALTALTGAERDLAASLEPNALARRAALSGLQQQAAREPLPSTDGGGLAAQLEELATHLDEMDAEALADAATALDALAAQAAQSLPALAGALGDAASALQTGDLPTAVTALRDAAASAGRAGEASNRQDALGQAGDAVGDAGDRLAGGSGDPGAGAEPGEGDGDGQGDGDGAGEGNGAGEGSGAGQGDGGGSGSGQGVGGASGVVGGSSAAGGSGAQGGAGVPNGTGDNASTNLDTSGVYDPVAYETGESGSASGAPGDDSTQTGTAAGTGTEGASRVPYGDVLGAYASRAAEAIDGLRLSPGARDVVRTYFEELEG